jgi:hypothetical protein
MGSSGISVTITLIEMMGVKLENIGRIVRQAALLIRAAIANYVFACRY